VTAAALFGVGILQCSPWVEVIFDVSLLTALLRTVNDVRLGDVLWGFPS
jgi:hypothetical protein